MAHRARADTAPLRRLLARDLFLLVGLAALTLVGLFFWGYSRAMEHDAQAQARGSLHRMQDRLRARLRGQQRSADELGRLWSSGVVDPERPDELQSTLLALAPLEGSFRSLGIMQPDGSGTDLGPTAEGWLETEQCRPSGAISSCRAHYWTRAGVLASSDDWHPIDYRSPDAFSRTWFGAAMSGARAWGEPTLMHVDGAYSNRFRMTYAALVARAGRTLGVVEVAVALDDMLDEVRGMQPSPACLTFISDAARRPILLPPLPQFRGIEATPAGKPVSADFLPTAASVFDAGARNATVAIDGERYYVVQEHFDSEPGIAWDLSLALPSGELLGGLRREAFVLLVLALCAVALVAWRALALVHRFSRPLRALAESSERATRGEAFEPPRTNITEIADLGARFEEAAAAIRDRARLEADLRQTQRVATIGTLAGGVAHDVNNQLAAMMALLEMAKRHAGKDSPAVPDLDLARDTVMSCAELTRGLLGFSRGGAASQKMVVDVNDVLERTSRLVGSTLAGARIELAMHLAKSLPPVLGDRVLLEQVVMNLVVNARDAMPDGGTITLASGRREEREIFFSVADDGTGIAPEAREHIFEAFFTTKPAGKGTGLGLTITQGIVVAHNGRIEIDSVRGRGSTFTVVLGAAEVSAG